MPAGIKYWSTTAASNNSAVPYGAPEGWAPSSVNNWGRQVMADVRSWYIDAEWIDFGDVPTRTGATTFTVPGDQTATYLANRRIKCTDSSTLYGYIVSSTYGALTTVTVALDSGSLSVSLSAVSVGIIKVIPSGTGSSLPNGVGDVTTTGTQTLTNKSLQDSTTFIIDESDATKKIAFQASGITTGTTRTFTAPDASGTLALTSNKLSTFAATTSSELAGVISDETGTGALVFGTSPTITTPNIVGTSTNNNASAGSVGELIEATLAIGSATSLTNGTPKTITSISLTAGDWDVFGSVGFTGTGTGIGNLTGCVSATDNTLETAPNGGAFYSMLAAFANLSGGNDVIPVGQRRVSIASTTTYYLVALCGFGGGTVSGFGYIGARRVR